MPRVKSEQKYRERFFNSFDKTDGCWIWKKHSINKYGSFWYNGKPRRAHRISWIFHFGIIPDNIRVCHKCDVRLCVRPDHLFLGTDKDNFYDAVKKGRIAKFGEKHPAAKLTDADVSQIRALYGTKISFQFLANLFKISKKQVMNIVKRKQRTET